MANFNKAKKFHFIYKTTNLLNGKYYIGMHSTNNINDGYMGSGKRLRYSINKYGEENFKREILEYLDTRELLVEREREIVNEELINDESCLNLKIGGTGGFSISDAKKGRLATNKILKEKYGEDFARIVIKNWRTQLTTEEMERLSYKIKMGQQLINFNHATFKDKKHSVESRRKISLAKTGKGKKENNSQYGTCWITDGQENKKIKKGTNIPEGWKLGRSI